MYELNALHLGLFLSAGMSIWGQAAHACRGPPTTSTFACYHHHPNNDGLGAVKICRLPYLRL